MGDPDNRKLRQVSGIRHYWDRRAREDALHFMSKKGRLKRYVLRVIVCRIVRPFVLCFTSSCCVQCEAIRYIDTFLETSDYRRMLVSD